jgi:hypothetical protein
MPSCEAQIELHNSAWPDSHEKIPAPGPSALGVVGPKRFPEPFAPPLARLSLPATLAPPPCEHAPPPLVGHPAHDDAGRASTPPQQRIRRPPSSRRVRALPSRAASARCHLAPPWPIHALTPCAASSRRRPTPSSAIAANHRRRPAPPHPPARKLLKPPWNPRCVGCEDRGTRLLFLRMFKDLSVKFWISL